jgi:hypothetical protein
MSTDCTSRHSGRAIFGASERASVCRLEIHTCAVHCGGAHAVHRLDALCSSPFVLGAIFCAPVALPRYHTLQIDIAFSITGSDCRQKGSIVPFHPKSMRILRFSTSATACCKRHRFTRANSMQVVHDIEVRRIPRRRIRVVLKIGCHGKSELLTSCLNLYRNAFP